MAEIWVPSAGIPGQERIRVYCSGCGNALGFRSGPTGTVEQDRPLSECDDCAPFEGGKP